MKIFQTIVNLLFRKYLNIYTKHRQTLDKKKRKSYKITLVVLELINLIFSNIETNKQTSKKEKKETNKGKEKKKQK